MIDQQVLEKPDCANPKCDNKGFIMLAGGFYCGDCVTKFHAKNQKNIIEALNSD